MRRLLYFTEEYIIYINNRDAYELLGMKTKRNIYLLNYSYAN